MIACTEYNTVKAIGAVLGCMMTWLYNLPKTKAAPLSILWSIAQQTVLHGGMEIVPISKDTIPIYLLMAMLILGCKKWLQYINITKFTSQFCHH